MAIEIILDQLTVPILSLIYKSIGWISGKIKKKPTKKLNNNKKIKNKKQPNNRMKGKRLIDFDREIEYANKHGFYESAKKLKNERKKLVKQLRQQDSDKPFKNIKPSPGTLPIV